MKTKILISLILSLSLTSQVFGTSFSAVGALSAPMHTSDTPGDSYSGSPMGFGALVSTGHILEFEFGVMYVGREVETQLASFHVLELPADFRFSIIPEISVAAGGYFSRALGAVMVMQGGVPLERSYEDLNYARNEAGLMFSISVATPLVPGLSFLTDVRYLYGLTHILDTVSDNSYFRGFQILAGLKVGL